MQSEPDFDGPFFEELAFDLELDSEHLLEPLPPFIVFGAIGALEGIVFGVGFLEVTGAVFADLLPFPDFSDLLDL